MSLPFYGFILVTNKAKTPLKKYIEWVESCIQHGVTSIQIREKTASVNELIILINALKKKISPYQVPLIMNDNVALAHALDMDGVHLGQNDGDPIKARQRLGPDKIIGVSINSHADLVRANTLPINYVGIGSIFPTTSKKDVNTIWGIHGLKQIAAEAKHPVVAIGGIHDKNVKDVLLAGAEGIAVIGALHNAPHPQQTAQQLRSMITQTNNDKSILKR